MLEVKPFSQRDRKYRELLNRFCACDWECLDEARRVAGLAMEDPAAALQEYGEMHGLSGGLDSLRIGEEELAASKRDVSEQFLTSISLARVNSRKFHEDQRRRGYVYDDADGVRMIRQVRAIGRVGICCGRSFSSLLMHTVPAQLAGVGEIAVAVEPDENGSVDPRILAMAKVLGIGEVYRLSGAHAVAALAFGAGPLRRVDKIVGSDGPISRAAKRLVMGSVGVDFGRGLGELLVIADDSANARFIAGDILAQAEHEDASTLVALFTNDRLLAEAVRIEVERLVERLPNSERIRRNIEQSGANYVFPDLYTAIAAANSLAPARVCLQTRSNDDCLADIDVAGAVFVGPWSAEASGDCFAGINPFLPVGGQARFASGLGIEDFIREMPVVEYGPDRLLKTGRHVAFLAEEEGMPAHAESVRERLELLKLTVD